MPEIQAQSESPAHTGQGANAPEWPRGEVAFVTGAASGIGLGISRALVRAGARVALADIDQSRLDAAAEALRDEGGVVATVRFDVSDPGAWEAAADAAEAELGPVTILCSNAGVNGGGSAEKTTYEVWKWVHAINIDAQFLGVATFLPRFREHGGRAHILNTASMAGLVPIPDVAAYASSKFASVGFSRALRADLAGSAIGVSVLCPGTVATRIVESAAVVQEEMLGIEADRAAVEGNMRMLSQGADPDAVGQQVVEAMAAGQFLIVTHKDFLPIVRGVNAEIESAFVDFDGRHGSDPTAALLVQGEKPVST
ncbi:SDR family NAD(P)-dependent oxidoreductase [Brevibacterium metallidurans]|uniref:SDR family NAD(P)-dependent oxidoreductase n=1 Tax=Brevibacterium metallidurans TaxID=1482676 RepID=A0ABP3C9C0_9MICO